MPLQKKKPVAMVRETGFKTSYQLEIKDTEFLADNVTKLKIFIASKTLNFWSWGAVI